MNKKEIFKKFIEENEVLIVDKNPGSRNRLLKTIYDLGGRRHMIHTTGKLSEAQEIIKTKKIGIVLSDYFIEGGSGFDLFNHLRQSGPDHKDTCLILVTANISQSAVAKAAEEDVDSFIIKPYTIQSIQENLISTIAQKIQPSEYILKIEEGKKLLSSKDYTEAINVLKVALELHSKPSLALFYIGQAEYLKNLKERASETYNEGLGHISIHYKCLIGLYELFLNDGKFDEAYQIVKKIAKYFPANPDRLAQIVRLTIRTEHYEDMHLYYEIFKSLDERAQLLINYMGAGMYIAGKHFLKNGEPDKAIQYFDYVAVSCGQFTKFLRAMISILVEFGMTEEAGKHLKRFTPEGKLTDDFAISDFLILSKKNEDIGMIIKNGLDLYNKNIRDLACIEALTKAMEQGGYNEDKIAPLREEIDLISASFPK